MTDTLASPDELELLADRILAMPPDRRRAWLLAQPPETVALVDRALAPLIDPDGSRVYRTLGYEPICIPRVHAALDAGFRNPLEAQAAGMEDLPPMCGRCPAERFDKATEFDVLFGGAAGGSKTLSTVMMTVRCLHRWPGFRALFLRETFDQLDENVYPELRKIDHARQVGGHWNAGRRQLDLGLSSCRFRYLTDIDDVLHRRGGSYQMIVLDERNLLPPGVADALRDRLRSADPAIPVIGFRSTANPGGKSHGELKRLFIVPTDYGAKVADVKVETAEFQRRYIPAKASDNPYLGPDYAEQVLGGIEDPVLRAAMAEGDWDKFSGQFFAEWSHALHVVPRFDIPKSWQRSSGTDYGRAAPWCHLSAARDNDSRVYVYREIYETGVGERDQARWIKENEREAGESGVKRYADPSMWAKDSDAEPIADTYKTVGVPLIAAANDRKSGWARVHTYLSNGVDPKHPDRYDDRYLACRYHAALGLTTCPLLHVLEGTAPNLVRTLPDLPFSKVRVEDLDTDAEDHAADTLRYLLMGQPLRPPRKHKLFGAQLRDMGIG